MVSCRPRKPKNPSPFFSVLDWLRILCSGCFGKFAQFKRPLLPGNPNGKLNLKMDNLVLQNCLRESIHSPTDRSPLFGAVDTPTAFAKDDEVIGDYGYDHDDDDDEHEESEGMFRGHFLLGSRVLTEVELQSPVEENRVLATPIRTPRRSNNSSCASLTTELHSSSSQSWALDGKRSNASSLASSTRDLPPGSSQVCALYSHSSSSLDVSTVFSSVRDVEASLSASRNVLSTHGEDNESFTDSYRRSGFSEVTCRAAPLYKLDKDRGLSDSSVTGDRDSNSSLRDSEALLKAEKTHLFSDSKQTNSSWKRAGSALECNLDDAPLKVKINSRHFDWRAAEKHTLLQEGQDRVPVGSLPDCTSFDFLVDSLEKKSDGRRLRARSLTDQDFTELKGCIDLGFVFRQDHVPDLRETLPALEVCYAVAHGAISPASNVEEFKSLSPGGSPPISPWRIASPGDQPQQVKARLRHWAQAVACNLRHPCNVSTN